MNCWVSLICHECIMLHYTIKWYIILQDKVALAKQVGRRRFEELMESEVSGLEVIL